MDLNDLSFYCVECGAIFEASAVEKRKLSYSGKFKTVFECAKCSGTDFEIYSVRLY